MKMRLSRAYRSSVVGGLGLAACAFICTPGLLQAQPAQPFSGPVTFSRTTEVFSVASPGPHGAPFSTDIFMGADAYVKDPPNTINDMAVLVSRWKA
jgi:hypothetical protein